MVSSASTVRVTDTLPVHWKYVSEGGATIVFSYHGPPNPDFDGTVLRLRKSTVPAVPKITRASDLGIQSPEPLVEVEEPDDPMIEYQKRCMERLIPPEHLPRLESVHVNREWLERLIAVHDDERPADRRARDQVDLNRTKGVLATDLVGGEWLAVEIKPKWAFLPPPTHLSETTRPIKTQTCRFCMHSHMRAKMGDTVSLGYCPLDLFSSDKDRVTKAIHSLWNAWVDSKGTVNNLKIFIRGKSISSSDTSSMFAESAEQTVQPRDAFTSALLPMLMDTPVLRLLSKLQRTLDCLDIEGLSNLWRLAETSAPLYRTTFASFFEKTHGTSGDTPPMSPIGVSSLFLTSPEPTISDWSAFLDTYLSPTSSQLDHSNPGPEDLRYYLLAYLLSATFKDCSIIIRLDPLQSTVSQSVQVKPERVTVIDLDPKSMDRLRKWERLDKEIVQAYLGVEERKVCADGWMEDQNSAHMHLIKPSMGVAHRVGWRAWYRRLLGCR